MQNNKANTSPTLRAFGFAWLRLFLCAGSVWSRPFLCLFAKKPYLCSRTNLFIMEFDIKNPTNEEAERLEASQISEETREHFVEEMVTYFSDDAVLSVQYKVMLWAYRYTKLPRIFRPLCLHFFKKHAKTYNNLVAFLYPPVEGAPLPVEELFY